MTEGYRLTPNEIQRQLAMVRRVENLKPGDTVRINESFGNLPLELGRDYKVAEVQRVPWGGYEEAQRHRFLQGREGPKNTNVKLRLPDGTLTPYISSIFLDFPDLK